MSVEFNIPFYASFPIEVKIEDFNFAKKLQKSWLI